MQYVKNLGFLQIEMYIITKSHEDPTSKLSEELLTDIVTVLAKHEVITDRLIIDFLSCEICEQKDILHKALIEAGRRIATEKLLADQKKQ